MREGIERRTIAAQVADRIAADIAAGIWQGFLPGKRSLAAHFSLNVKTCAAAMELLERRGVIGPAGAGRRRPILGQPLMVRRNSRALEQRLLIVHQSGIMNAADYQILQKMGAVWEKASGLVMWTTVDFSRCKQAEPRLDALLKRYHPDALLLHMPGLGWHEATALKVPTYLLGGTSVAGLPISISACSMKNEMVRILTHLRDLGHRRILVPTEGLTDPIWQSIRDSLSSACGSRPEVGMWEDYCPRFPGNAPGAWEGYWNKVFPWLRPTAVVVLDDTHLLSLYGYCQMTGRKIPKDVSVLGFNYEERFEWMRPRPTMMRYPEKQSVAHFRLWVEGGLKPIGRKVISLEMIVGESTGPARA